MKTTITLISLLLLLAGCTTAGGFSSSDQFYYSRTTHVFGFSWDNIYYCKKQDSKGPAIKVDCKKVDVGFDESSGKPQTPSPWQD